ncbi:hypothetical protein [Pseudomonas matsuisoli]|uniref:Uncharacterized protein n=1 Tax=Pseudomonas matsuisoli TaxID=1515666 RepID=A0A917Q4V7_9PSED|nr:hypothetical protein [Pseudomonas matsuisoli]GGK09151.1 hypothetical protein GCM10009304_39120 [Pseudomonas matsuisoli]
MEEYKPSKLSDCSGVCHILASGWSLNCTLSSINKDDYVIGFNFSFLAWPNADVHFIENASLKNEYFLDNTVTIYEFLKRFSVLGKGNLVFKNLSEFKNSVRLVGMLYGRHAKFIRDRHYRVFNGLDLDHVLRDMMEDEFRLPQAYSSVISMVFLARRLGFKTIVVHGLDFSGPHFYEDLEKVRVDGFCPSEIKEIHSRSHKTAVGENGIGVGVVISKIKGMLKLEDIELYAAGAISPSASIIGVRPDLGAV